MSLNGVANPQYPLTVDGLQIINADAIYINGQPVVPDLGVYLPLSGGTMTGSINMGLNSVTSLPAPINSNDAVNKIYVDTATSALVPYSGGTTNVNLGTHSLIASTAQFTNVSSATPSLALGIDASGNLNTFAVPVTSNILPLNNMFTGTNQFNNTVTNGTGYTTNINGILQTNLTDLGYTSASFSTSGIVGAYTPPLGTITNVSGSTYQIAQTSNGRSIMAIPVFGVGTVNTTYVFNFTIDCTVGTATISVEQNNILRSPQLYPLSTGFNTVIGSFTVDGTSNTPVFKIYTGVSSWNAQWSSFSLSSYSISVTNSNMSIGGSNKFIQPYNALSSDTTVLVNRQTLDNAISTASILPLNNTFTGTNTFNNNVTIGSYPVSVANTTVIQPKAITTSVLTTSGLTSVTTAGTITYSAPTYTFTSNPTTSPVAACYWASPQTFLTGAWYTFTFTSLTPSVAGINLTVSQANVGNTGYVAISSLYTLTSGNFSGVFTPNSNSSYLGQVYLQFSGMTSHNVTWTGFTINLGTESVNGNFSVANNTTLSGSVTIGPVASATALTISSSGTYQPTIVASSSSSDTTIDLSNTATSGRKYRIGSAGTGSGAALGSLYFYDATASAIRMYIDNSGNTNVNNVLTVYGDFCRQGTTASNYMLIQDGGASNTPEIEFFLGYLRKLYIGFCDSTNSYIAADGSNNIALQAGGSTQLSVNSAGYVNVPGYITTPNQAFCITTCNTAASVSYTVGVVGNTYLVAGTSAGLSNSGTNGWITGLGRFYTPYAGKWYVTVNMYFNSFAGGSRMAVNHLNSGGGVVEQRYCMVEQAGIAADTTRTNSGLYYCSVGDYFTVSVTTGSCTMFFGSVTHTCFQFHFLG